MIATDLAHIEGQIAMTPALRKGLDFLKNVNNRELSAGRIVIDGDRVQASVQFYTTVVTETPQWEAHRRYIDLQFIVSGEEVIAWTPVDRMKITKAYDEAKDTCVGTALPEDSTRVHLRAGQLAVLYPEDAHVPKLAAGSPVPVTKIVVKVAA